MEQTAIFAAGCFWGVEAAFMNVSGVIRTRVGYTGGTAEHPTYEQVCAGGTGHQEVVEVVFDTDIVSYDDLLKVFWRAHDPTTRDRQGFDIGEQYRSAIFYFTDEQRAAAEASKATLQESGAYKGPVVTAISPASVFYEAEEYHQKYFEKKGGGTCSS